ncbi:60Kd inner membrane protein-domain-containing protein [Naematelia encephala]|uniref:60Kd inner membrane protein-domain-containing protein n=1 Tax=Naematelia encephala TaxID=71784 RepID=A0A1Y2BIX1_9TREE|nr:60Kd inner membrane protein-domain-containing protein [Naematelia encephala]
MLSRSITRRAVRLNTQPSGRSLARNYSVMTPSRVSPVALSKRPMKPLSVSPMRQFSWTPWRAPSSDTPVSSIDSAPASASTSTSTAESVQSLATQQSTPTHEPLFSEPSTSAASSATVESTSSLADAAATVDPTLPLHANGQTLGELIVNTPLPLADILQSPAAIEAVCTKADLGLIGLTHSWYSLPGWAVDGMVALHNMTGAPWWATIGMMTVLIRLCLFPVFLKAHGNNARFQAIQPEFTELAKKISDAKKKNDSLEMQQYTASLQNLLKVHKTNPAKALLLPLSQLPVFLTMFSAVRWMAETPIPQMKQGGFSFFTDLTATDPTYILPITSMVLTNIVLRVSLIV